MLGTSIFITLLAIVYFYMHSKTNKKELMGIVSFFVIACVWSMFFIFAKYQLNFWVALLFLCVYLGLGYYFFTQAKQKSLKIIASQESYWEVDADVIGRAFKYTENEKKDRIEIYHENSTFFIKDDRNKKHLSRAFWEKFNHFEKTYVLTKIKMLSELQEFRIFALVYHKILQSLEEQEIELELDEVLKKFEYTVEFFLIYLWKTYMKHENIGIGQLQALINSEYEEEFIHALDNALLCSVKFSGAYLIFQYENFLEGSSYGK
jgi:Ca2+/Na+ antiporter